MRKMLFGLASIVKEVRTPRAIHDNVQSALSDVIINSVIAAVLTISKHVIVSERIITSITARLMLIAFSNPAAMLGKIFPVMRSVIQ